ncbi:MAG: ribosomal-protein-alanine N-acetyltransferase [Paraglaciecola sp.]|jgi:ribosomal-protein-alanine N-acetyltransferase
MNLIQLNETQLEKFIKSGVQPYNLKFNEGAIPPIHVLRRSMDLFHYSVDPVWSLPYFIQKETQIIGCCGFKGSPCKNRIEIGYNVSPDAQGLGIATSAVKQLSQIAFNSDLVSILVALISSDNKASLNVVHKNGFSYKKLVVDDDGEQLECWELNHDFSDFDVNY